MKRRQRGHQRPGRDIDGWLALDKPEGITSSDAMLRVNRYLRARKVGHAGTLDRPATGVLVLAFGQATKVIQFVMNMSKSYVFVARFGQATETDDATGDVIAESESRPDKQQILDVLDQFRGTILQRPPDYSAVKIKGRRAADRVRAGESVELALRTLRVHRLELLRMIDGSHAEFILKCGKGGYVRSIARDIGEALGCHAHVLSLRRNAVGPFLKKDCIKVPEGEELEVAGEIERRLRTLEFGFGDIPSLECTEEEAEDILVGRPVRLESGSDASGPVFPVWISWKGYAVAIGELTDGIFRPKRVFNASRTEGSVSGRRRISTKGVK